MFTPPMYRHLSEPSPPPVPHNTSRLSSLLFHSTAPRWALTLLACLAFALSFVPWLFYFSGARIRSWSRWTLH